MTAVEELRARVAGLRRDEIRNQAGEVYMRRYHIRYRKAGCLRIHEILLGDDARDLHDHPWDFQSRLLLGSYVEVTPDGQHEWSPADRVLRRRAEYPHRLELESPVWTMFQAGPVRRRWGFHTADGWVPWRTYLARSQRRQW